MKKCPFTVPAFRYNQRRGVSAVVNAMTEERVVGRLKYSSLYKEYDRDFNVKHDGKTFSIGSGSSKIVFHFENIGRKDWKPLN